MTDHILISNLKFNYYPKQPVLDIHKLQIPLHRFIIFYGRSGSGKSTLLKIIAGLLPKYGGHLSGKVTIPERKVPAMMFQDPGAQFALDTPRHEIEFALENIQTPPSLIKSKVLQALKEVGIMKLADRKFTTLSGGEQQRVTLAVIIAMKRQIVLLDEPFASLDINNRKLIINQLIKMQQAGKTIIIADHDLSAYRKLNPVIIDFNDDVKLLTPVQQQSLLKASSAPIELNTPLPSNSAPSIITLHHFSLSRQNQLLINQTELEIIKNKTTLITGPSGSGKSSFFKAIANLIPYDGSVMLLDQDLSAYSRSKMGQTLGLMFQNANDQFLNVTVGEEIALSQRNGHHPYFTNERLQRALHDLQLDDFTDHIIYSLSGGQKKKLQILIMLMMGQPLLLLDEPFSGLDRQSIDIVVNLIQRCQKILPQTILIISHQLMGALPLVDYHLRLIDQQLIYQGADNS